MVCGAGGSYERVAETARMHARKQRAQLILDFERTMSEAERSNVQWHPTYLHLLLPKDDEVQEELAEEDAGTCELRWDPAQPGVP